MGLPSSKSSKTLKPFQRCALALSNSIAYQNSRGLHYLRRWPQAHFNVATKNRGVLMRKGKVAVTLIASIFWFVGFFVSPSHGKLIVGLSSVNVAFLPVYVTEDRGFFKAEGLDVLLVLFNAGATNLQALVGGDIQIMGSAF